MDMLSHSNLMVFQTAGGESERQGDDPAGGIPGHQLRRAPDRTQRQHPEDSRERCTNFSIAKQTQKF